MSFVQKLIKQTSAYMIGESLILIAGFISFPIFTRILSTKDYGMMNLVGISLSLVEAFSSVGLRHGSQRFYDSYLKRGVLDSFYATTLVGSLVFGLLGTFGIIVICYIGSVFGLVSDLTLSIFVLSSFLVVIRVLSKIIGCIFRVREYSGTYAVFAVITKYVGMSLSIIFVTIYLYGVWGFFLGLVVGELLVLALLWCYLSRDLNKSRVEFSTPLFKQMVSYGLPLVVSGFAGTLLTLGDRYIIGLFMTASDVAIYSVPYNLCTYLQAILLTAFEFAFIPLIMKEWSSSRINKVNYEIARVIKLYCIAAFPIAFAVIALGDQFIVLLASEKYIASSKILPYVVVGELLKGLFTPIVIGLQFHNQTKTIVKITWLVVAVNLLLNIILIPIYGILGAALSTLICYILLLISGRVVSVKTLKVKLPWFGIITPLTSSIFMYCIILGFEKYLYCNLFCLVILGGLSYVLSLAMLDRRILKSFHDLLNAAAKNF